VQAKLLRVLEGGQFERLGSSTTRQVDVRVIAATNRDLAVMIDEGSFRQDLYYRLNVFPIMIPPLRERPEDIPLLIQAFIKQLSRNRKTNIEHIPRRNLEQLQRYSWPGNVRELRNVVEHAMIISKGNRLKIQIPDESPSGGQRTFSLKEIERQHILEVLEHTGWRVSGKHGAAELLELKPTTLVSRMKKLGITRPQK
jgi:transcriptional regulator with GAF, ATPase, and Fis domain